MTTARKILRFREVQHLSGNLSRTTIWRKIRSGQFPAPVQLGPNAIGWFEDQVLAHQESLSRVAYAPSETL